jgi:uncharacterized membrane protein
MNPLFSVPFNIITILEIFEEIPTFDKLLKDSEGNISRKKISITRIALLTVLFVLTLLSTNIAVIFDLVGALFGPILGLILPVSLYLQPILTSSTRSSSTITTTGKLGDS